LCATSGRYAFEVDIRGREISWSAVALAGAGVIAIAVVVFVLSSHGKHTATVPPTTGPTNVASTPASASAVVAASAKPVPIVAAFFGDSYISGSAMDSGEDMRWPHLVSKRMGWTPYLLGVGGSGFIATGQGDSFIQRVPRLMAAKPQIVIIQGGHNDVTYPRPQIEAAAKLLIDTIHADLPAAKLVVIAPFEPTNPTFSTAIAIEGYLKADAEAVGALFIDPIVDNWLQGRASTLIGSDGTHPTDAGEAAISTYVLSKLLPAFPVASPSP
jgi:lysophospholipase L1-like esterase